MTKVTKTIVGNPANGGMIITDLDNIPEMLAAFPAFNKALAKVVAQEMKQIMIKVWETDGAVGGGSAGLDTPTPGSIPTKWEITKTSKRIKADRGAPKPGKPLYGVSRDLRGALETETDADVFGFESRVTIGDETHSDARGLSVSQVALMVELGISPTGVTEGPAARPKFGWFTKSADVIGGKVQAGVTKAADSYFDQFTNLPRNL